MQLLSVEFCVVRTVHKFELTLVINETTSKWRPVERLISDINSCFWYDLHVFHRPPSRQLKASTHAVEVNCILLSNEQYNIYEIKLIMNKISFLESPRTTTGTWSERPANYRIEHKASFIFMRCAIIIPSKQKVKYQFESQQFHPCSMQIRSKTAIQTSNTSVHPHRSSTWPDPSLLLTAVTRMHH